jgi:hypothetical protein
MAARGDQAQRLDVVVHGGRVVTPAAVLDTAVGDSQGVVERGRPLPPIGRGLR